ncbi:MAG: ribonuclease J [Oligoflexales bacterium]|nr:ribonuclease J [Oligoflexales bacterium]
MNQLEILDQLKNRSPQDVFIIIFGGCRDFGMNLTGYYNKNRLFLVDCGTRFTPPWYPGVDRAMPDIDPAVEKLGGIHSYLITHAHEDHIGALPYLLKKWPAPIYGTPWSIEIIKDKLTKMAFDISSYNFCTVIPGDRTVTDNFDCEWLHVNHSVPMSVSLLMVIGGCSILHSGDFRLDESPLYESSINLNRLKNLAQNGLDYYLCDSTNANSESGGTSEKDVFLEIEKVFKQTQGAIFFTTFSSNYWRIRSALELGEKLGRKIVLVGSGIQKSISLGRKLGLDRQDADSYLEEIDSRQYSRKKLLFIVSGCQGEHRSALARIINGEHQHISLNSEDTLIFSSRAIPGNDIAIQELISKSTKIGAHVITDKTNARIHASGHAYRRELSAILDILKPRNYIPIHGAFTQLRANRQIASELNESGTKSHCMENGDILHLKDPDPIKIGTIQFSESYIDSWSQMPIPEATVKERIKISTSGLCIASGIFSFKEEKWIQKPDFEYLGLHFPETLNLDDFERYLTDIIESDLSLENKSRNLDHIQLNELLRLKIRRELATILIKKPIVKSKFHFL